MPAVGGAGSLSTHAQEMAFFTPGGFRSGKDKQLVNNHPGSGPSLHPGPRGSGHSAPRPVSEDQAIAAHPGGWHKQNHLCKSLSSSGSSLYRADAAGPPAKTTVSMGVGGTPLFPWLPGEPQRVWPFCSPVCLLIQVRNLETLV